MCACNFTELMSQDGHRCGQSYPSEGCPNEGWGMAKIFSILSCIGIRRLIGNFYHLEGEKRKNANYTGDRHYYGYKLDES